VAFVAGSFLAVGVNGVILVCCAATPPPAEDEDDEGEAEPPPAARPACAAPVMDARAKKLFVQLDDPAQGQRMNALELLRARLAKDGRTFRDLLHEFEGRPNG
jgi:hypothetical protein